MTSYDAAMSGDHESPEQAAKRRGVREFLTQHAAFTSPIQNYVARDWLYDWAVENVNDPDFPKLYAFYVLEVRRLTRRYVAVDVLADTFRYHWQGKEAWQRIIAEVPQLTS
jgi:hypothetical protein